jgi:hypothetical protein
VADRAIRCNCLSGSRSCRHDHWKEALSRVSAHAGCCARTKRSYTSAGVAAVGRQGARADIEMTLPEPKGPTLLATSIIHPCCRTYIATASQEQGAAPLCVTGANSGRLQVMFTPVTPSCPPASTGTNTSAGPPCGTFVPRAISCRRAPWQSPGGRFLLVPTQS